MKEKSDAEKPLTWYQGIHIPTSQIWFDSYNARKPQPWALLHSLLRTDIRSPIITPGIIPCYVREDSHPLIGQVMQVLHSYTYKISLLGVLMIKITSYSFLDSLFVGSEIKRSIHREISSGSAYAKFKSQQVIFLIG